MLKKLFIILSVIILTDGCIPGSDSYNDGPSNLEVANTFKDSMVFQQVDKTSIWGKAYKTTKIKVEFNGVDYRVVTGNDGTWKVDFSTKIAGGPFELIISTNDSTVVFNDVYVVKDIDTTSYKK